MLPLFELLKIKLQRDKRTFLSDFFAEMEACNGKKSKENILMEQFIVSNFQLLRRNLRLRSRVIKN